VDASKKTLYALTFLALAVNDDQLDQDCMDQAVVEYTKKNLGCTMFADIQGVVVYGNGPGGEKRITWCSRWPRAQGLRRWHGMIGRHTCRSRLTCPNDTH
jgi:hypothetical protein